MATLTIQLGDAEEVLTTQISLLLPDSKNPMDEFSEIIVTKIGEHYPLVLLESQINYAHFLEQSAVNKPH